MKKQLLIVSILGLLGASGAIIANSAKEVMKGAEAYSISSLPTTIDLNDSTDSEIRNYYSSLNSLSASEKQGTNLLKNLKPILKNGQKYWSYDNTSSNIWKIYEIADRDWEKSPADHLTYGTYNSSTNTITGYQYGTSTSNGKNNPYLHSLYVNRNVDNQVRAWDDHSPSDAVTAWGINREHVWAKSHGMGSTDTSENSGGARGDPMHLWSGNAYVNQFDYHGNLFFGFVNKNKSYTDAGNDSKGWTHLSGNLKGTSATFGFGTVFEPQDCDKGDIARICFYMAARYNYLSGSDSDGIDGNNPWLTLYDGTSDPNGSSTYDSNESKQGYMGVLRDLLAWNRLDPPDEWEIHRNNLLFKNYTNNRNPFIDFPEWAEYIWGSSTLANDERSVISYSSNPTGSANPTSDNINTFPGQGQTVAVSSVEVFPSSLSVNVGDQNMLSAIVLPDNATNKNVTWTSNNNGIVSINSNGIFTANAAGVATIKATANNGVYGTCTITVTGGQTGQVTQYELVTDGLHNGDEVVITAQQNKYSSDVKVMTKVTKTYSYYWTPEDGTANQGVLNKTSAMPVWTVRGTNGSFTFENDGDYMYGVISGSYKNLYLNGSSTSNGNTWTVNQNSASSGYDVYNDVGVYLEYYSGGDRFTGWSSSAKDYVINFFRKVTKTIYSAEEFATTFLESIQCDATGETPPTLSRSWSSLSSMYADVETSQKGILVNAVANENGDIVEQAMARYDFLCRKYSQFNNFINRASANPSNSNNPLNRLVKNYSLQIAFPIAGAVVVIGLIVLVSLKKKKII